MWRYVAATQTAARMLQQLRCRPTPRLQLETIMLVSSTRYVFIIGIEISSLYFILNARVLNSNISTSFFELE